MARVRTRAKRTVYLLVALAILFLLLELNRWLPGAWPGGGGGGFRTAGQLGVDDPTRTGGRDAPPADATTDPDAVEPPETPPAAWPPRKGVVVEVRGPAGELAEGWRLGVGDGGAEGGRPDADGTLRIRDRKVFSDGFRIRSSAGVLRHREGTNERAARWSIHLPSAALPAQRAAGTTTLRVVDAVSGEPVVGARVAWRAGGEPQAGKTDAQGQLALRGPRGAAPFRVRVEASGHAPREHVVLPRDPRGGDVRLDELVDCVVRFAPSSSSVVSARIVAADGRGLAWGEVSVRGGGSGQSATFRIAKRRLTDGWLQATVGTSAGRYVFRRPLAGIEGALALPASKQVTLHVRNAQGETVRTAKTVVEVDTYAGAGAEDEPHPVGAQPVAEARDGKLTFVTPAGARTRLRVEVPGAAPMVRTLTPLDGVDTLDFVAEAGIRVPVQVFGWDGQPLPGARVVARTSMQGMRIRREAVTDGRGRALVGTFAAGSIELFAGAPGHGADAQVAEAASAMATVELRLPRGYPLHVVVEDPFGRALGGVDVEVAPSGGGAPLVMMPTRAAHVTGAAGKLTLPGLPNGLYDVRLTKPGYGTQKLRRVRPGAVTYFATLVSRP